MGNKIGSKCCVKETYDLKSAIGKGLCAFMCLVTIVCGGNSLYAEGFIYTYYDPDDCFAIPGPDNRYYVGWVENGAQYYFEEDGIHASCECHNTDSQYLPETIILKSEISVSYGGKTYTFKCPIYGVSRGRIEWNLWDGTIEGYQENYFRKHGKYQSIPGGGVSYDLRYPVKRIVLDDGIKYVHEYGFHNMQCVQSIKLPKGLRRLEKYTCSYCISLTDIDMPDSITYIGDHAFAGCRNLTSILWPKDLRTIGEETFGSAEYYNCGITSAILPDGVQHIGSSAFRGCNKLEEVYIPDTCTNIGYRAFSGCTNLSRVRLPQGITLLLNALFSGCVQLREIEIPDSVMEIWEEAFSGCSGLASVTIPNSVTSIGEKAFYNCSGLTSVTIGTGVTSIEDYAFEGCSGLTSVTIPDSVTSIGGYAFYDCGGLTNVTIGNGVTSIESSAFSGCSGLTSVTIPNSVTIISYGAFYGCTNVTSLTAPFVPSGIYGAKLTSVTIPDSVTSIGGYAFSGCSGLASVTIPNSVTSIGEEAFYNCSGLTSVTIGTGVTSIGEDAFEYCSGPIVFKGSPPRVVNEGAEDGVIGSGVGIYPVAYKAAWETVIDANGYWHGLKMQMEGPAALTLTEEAVDWSCGSITLRCADADMSGVEHSYWLMCYDEKDGKWREIDGAHNVKADWETDANGKRTLVAHLTDSRFATRLAGASTVKYRVMDENERLAEWTWEIDKDAGFVVRYHGNGGVTDGGADIFDQRFSFGESQSLSLPFKRGENVFLGWQAGGDIYDANVLATAYRFYAKDSSAFKSFNMSFASFKDGLDGDDLINNGAATLEKGIPVLHLYAIWTTSLYVHFYDADGSQDESLKPAYLNDHIWWQCSEGIDTSWHKGSPDVAELPPGPHTIEFKIDDGYDKIATLYNFSMDVTVKSRAETESTVSFSAPTRTQHVWAKVLGGMSSWKSVYFDCVGEGGADIQGLEAFDPKKARVRVYNQDWVKIGVFRGNEYVELPTGDYTAVFRYDGSSWMPNEQYRSRGVNFTLSKNQTTDLEISMTYLPFGGDGVPRWQYYADDGSLTRVIVNASGVSVFLPAEISQISANAFAGCDEVNEIVFEGNAPEVEPNAFVGLPSDCVIRVSSDSIGWGVDIPGMWNGMRIAYIEDSPTPEPTSDPVTPDPVTPDPVNPPDPTNVVESLNYAGSVDTEFAGKQEMMGALCDAKGNVVGLVTVKFGKKNKKGVVKVSASATMIVGGKAKKISAKAVSLGNGEARKMLAFKEPIGEMVFEMDADGTFTLKNGKREMVGLKEVGGTVQEVKVGGSLADGAMAFKVEFESLPDVGEILEPALPTNVTAYVSGGKKFDFGKAASPKYRKDRASGAYGLTGLDDPAKRNLSGLKLKYAPKTGIFKGSFKVYATTGGDKPKLKKYTVNVIGFAVDGAGVGWATLKKPSAEWTVTIER